VSVGLLLVLGCVLRVLYLIHAPGLRSDEAKLAVQIGIRPVTGLLQTLGFGQVASPGFLLLEKGLFILGAGADWVLRLLPLAASLLALWAFLRLARRVLEPLGSWAATGLMAFAPVLVLFSWQVKPYVLDALVAIVLLDLGLRVSPPSGAPKLVTQLGLLGLGAILLSIPAPFVLAGVGGVTLWQRRSESRVRWPLVAWAVVWMLTFGTLTLFLFPPTTAGSFLGDYWRGAFLDLRDPVGALKLAVRLLNGWFLGVGAGADLVAGMVLLAGCFVLGLIRLGQPRNRSTLALIASPLVLALFAALLQRWPIAPRLLMFAAPSVALILGAGVDAIATGSRVRRAIAGAVAITLVAIPALSELPSALLQRFDAEGRTVAFAKQYRGPLPVYVVARALPMWLYYSTDWKHPLPERLALAEKLASPGGILFGDLPPEQARRLAPGAPPGTPYQGYLELWGRGSGVSDSYTIIERAIPVPGWSGAEAGRIAALDPTGAWLFLWGAHASERSELLNGLAERSLAVDSSQGAVVRVTRPAR
jgi:hypothetical protein